MTRDDLIQPFERLNNDNTEIPTQSFIESITCSNLAGIFDYEEDKDQISFSMGRRMVAVTGETGSGKSLLLSKLVDVLSGGKAMASLVPKEGDITTIGMTLCLVEPHLSWVQEGLTEAGYKKLPERDGVGRLSVERILERRTRLASTSKINNMVVTMKAVRQVVAPLVVVVDAPSAAASLGRPQSRISVLDSGVEPGVLIRVRDAHAKYAHAKNQRKQLEKDLKSTPTSISGEVDVDLLKHWVDEIGTFREKIEEFCERLSGETTSDSIASAFALTQSVWSADESSSTYSKLIEFQDELREIDTRMESATLAQQMLTGCSDESAMTAVDRARDLLVEAAAGKSPNDPLSVAAEKAHNRINVIELALKESARVLDEESGLIGLLDTMRSSLPVSVEDVDSLISQWSLLARKHGVAPFSLPTCLCALQNELTGDVDTRSLLMDATELEEETLVVLSDACSQLSEARIAVAESLSKSVTQRLPTLGMAGAKLVVDVHPSVEYSHATSLGVDKADYLLLYEESSERGGKLDAVASSGEKARIMLAMECELPGSAGALCRASEIRHLPPVAVLYDEIDAHVGGRAAVSMARMLAEQSGQVISITHSPSVASVADTHLVVQKYPASVPHRVPVTVKRVDGDMRRKELARMASGDLAADEAENFADALLRDGEAWRNRAAEHL